MNKTARKVVTIMDDIVKNTKMNELNYADTLAFLKERSLRSKARHEELEKKGQSK